MVFCYLGICFLKVALDLLSYLGKMSPAIDGISVSSKFTVNRFDPKGVPIASAMAVALPGLSNSINLPHISFANFFDIYFYRLDYR
jgi:hypothetical protein